MSEQATLPFVSVIIPTYNRKDSLLRTLDSLARQTYPADRFEVIVVDDGGNDGTEEVVQRRFPFVFHYLRQSNQGATAARNWGVEHCQSEYLIFLDDDIEVASNSVRALVDALTAQQKTIILGDLHLPPELVKRSPFTNSESRGMLGRGQDRFVPFLECLTGLLAIRKSDFFSLGLFQDPTGGWPNWDDVDFGYRAHQAGFQFWRSGAAVGFHWDYSAIDFKAACERWRRAGRSASRLLAKYPDLKDKMSMFVYKSPIDRYNDSFFLILHKASLQILYAPLIVLLMERIIPMLEQFAPQSRILRQLYRWIISGYIFRGYREGLAEQQRHT